MKTYTVHAKRWSGGWELHINNVGVTQSHGLADADRMARDYVSLVTDTPADSFELEIVPEIDTARPARSGTPREIADSRTKRAEAVAKVLPGFLFFSTLLVAVGDAAMAMLWGFSILGGLFVAMAVLTGLLAIHLGRQVVTRKR